MESSEEGLRRLVPRGLRSALRRRLDAERLRYARWRYRLSGADLPPFLARLGVRRGDVLFVHSSFDALREIEGVSPVEVIRLLQAAVGPEGTLLMPTLPFSESAIDWAATDPTFDVRRTPSRMGLLSELFRRLPGAVRSVHPTHSVAAAGPAAEAMVADHHRAATPCGRPSPYHALLERGGRILFLGVDVSSMTFFHTVEELLEGRLPFPPFTETVYCLKSRAADGSMVETRTRLFEPSVAEARRRFEEGLEPRMRRRGTWRAARLGLVPAVLLDARDVVDALEDAVA